MRNIRRVSFWQLLSKLLQIVSRPSKRAQVVTHAPVTTKRHISQRKRNKRNKRKPGGILLDANSPIFQQIRNLDR